MADKEIIIDGVDVSEWTDEEVRYKFEKHSPKAIRQIAFDLYKQLKRKEQECEELKEQIKKYSKINELVPRDFAKLNQALDKIKKICQIKEENSQFVLPSVWQQILAIINKVKNGEQRKTYEKRII